jgi:hypothetical protein
LASRNLERQPEPALDGADQCSLLGSRRDKPLLDVVYLGEGRQRRDQFRLHKLGFWATAVLSVGGPVNVHCAKPVNTCFGLGQVEAQRGAKSFITSTNLAVWSAITTILNTNGASMLTICSDSIGANTRQKSFALSCYRMTSGRYEVTGYRS